MYLKNTNTKKEKHKKMYIWRHIYIDTKLDAGPLLLIISTNPIGIRSYG